MRYANPAASRLLGAGQEDLAGRPLPAGLQREGARRRVASDCRAGAEEVVVESFRVYGPGDLSRYLEALVVDLGDGSGRTYYLRDVTGRKRREEELAYRALHDPLTGLANRALFLDRLEQARARASRRGEPFAVIFLDLDGMKRANDSLGHESGDRLLVAVGGRLQACLRPSDTAARFGGDEFAVLLEDIPREEVRNVVERIVESLRAPIEAGGRTMRVTASAGVVVEDSGRMGVDALLRAADAAMYRAKSDGRDRYAFFKEDGA